jgi:hypothetical protein
MSTGAETDKSLFKFEDFASAVAFNPDALTNQLGRWHRLCQHELLRVRLE